MGHVLVHLPKRDAIVSFGGFVRGVKGGYSTQVLLLDLGTHTWTEPNLAPRPEPAAVLLLPRLPLLVPRQARRRPPALARAHGVHVLLSRESRRVLQVLLAPRSSFKLQQSARILDALGTLAAELVVLLEDGSTLFYWLIGIDVRNTELLVLPYGSSSGQDALAVLVYRGGTIRRTAVVAVADLRG